jgi:hypothetical protein
MGAICGMMRAAERHVRDEWESLTNLLRNTADVSGNIQEDLGWCSELRKLIY